jgi:hypothetical protein
VDLQLQSQTSSDDFAQLSKILGSYASGGSNALSASPSPTCGDYVTEAKNALGDIGTLIKDPKNYLTPSAPPGKAIPLEDSLKGWHDAIVPELSGLQTVADHLMSPPCSADASASAFLAGDYQVFDKFRKKVEGNHIAQGQAVASTGDVASVAISVTESSQGVKLTQFDKTLHFSSMLTLSGGVLFSELQNRSYIQRQVPATSGTGTMNVLGVDGLSGPTPLLLGLLNYKIPYLDFAKWCVSVSSGPAIRLGAKSRTSSFGYFGGISIHLWHRLFITPGIHVGNFADYPTGLTMNQTIPANFGQLTPVNRWSARFAIGLTYRTIDLGPLSGQSQNVQGNANAGTSVPAVTFDHTSLTFALQPVNSASAAQTVTVTNSGKSTLTITAIGVTGASGDYSSANTCGSSIAAGATCTITVIFKPTVTGTRAASVSMADNAVGSPHSISLSGVGAPPPAPNP